MKDHEKDRVNLIGLIRVTHRPLCEVNPKGFTKVNFAQNHRPRFFFVALTSFIKKLA